MTEEQNNQKENESESVTDKRDRTTRREDKRAEDLLNELMKKFIDFKNANFVELDGDILIDPQVMIRMDDLNWGWRAYCKSAYKRLRIMRYNFNAFKESAEKHIESHRALCWVNRIMSILKEDFNFTIDEDLPGQIAKGYKRDINPKNIAIQIVLSKIGDFMHTFEIPDLFYRGNFASCLEELSQQEYIYFIELYLKNQNGEINSETFKYLMLLKLANIKLTRKFNRQVTEDDQEGLFATDNLQRLAALMDSFFKKETVEGTEQLTLDIQTTKCIIKKVLHYYGPDDLMQNCSFYEYRTAHEYFREYITSGDESALDRMIAVLYRPKKLFYFIRKRMKSFDGDIRDSVKAMTNPTLMNLRAKMISKLDYSVKYGIMLFFYSIEKHLRSGKIVIGGTECDMNVLYEGNDETENDKFPGIGMTGLLFSMAESKVFGNVEETDKQGLWDIMARLYQVTIDNKKQLADLKHDTTD